MITGGVILEPEGEVKVLGGALDVEEIFLQILEANRRQMPTSEYVLKADIEDGGEATRADLAYGRRWIAKAVLDGTGRMNCEHGKQWALTGNERRPLGVSLDGGG